MLSKVPIYCPRSQYVVLGHNIFIVYNILAWSHSLPDYSVCVRCLLVRNNLSDALKETNVFFSNKDLIQKVLSVISRTYHTHCWSISKILLNFLWKILKYWNLNLTKKKSAFSIHFIPFPSDKKIIKRAVLNH